jgi:hypothetical protein
MESKPMSEEWVPFDKRNAALLKAVGFSITDEPNEMGEMGEVASVKGEMKASVVQTADGRLRLLIDLPDGGEINADIALCPKCGRHPVIRPGPDD